MVDFDEKQITRFKASVGPADANGCRLWLKLRSAEGYGQFSEVENKPWVSAWNYQAHRVAFALANGPIPDGMLICHSCDTPACCNPGHLFAGTHGDNMADAVSKGRPVRWKKLV